MGLDMRQIGLLSIEKSFQRADLVEDEGGDFITRHLDFAAAKPFAIRKTRMSADLHALPLGLANGPPHHCGIGGMEAAGDVDMRDVVHKPLVLAKAVDSERFTHVAVDRGHSFCPIRRTSSGGPPTLLEDIDVITRLSMGDGQVGRA